MSGWAFISERATVTRYGSTDSLPVAHGSAAELGHIPVNGATGLCRCGMTGCAESLCCGRWLSAWQELNVPDIAITEVFRRYAGHPDLVRFIDIAAQVIATDINLFDPHISVSWWWRG